ncbi:MAG: hypothetical protein R2748_18995 [Bryobacterales bacterium]
MDRADLDDEKFVHPHRRCSDDDRRRLALYRPEPGLLLVLAFDILFAGCVVPLFAGVYWPCRLNGPAVAPRSCAEPARGSR